MKRRTWIFILASVVIVGALSAWIAKKNSVIKPAASSMQSARVRPPTPAPAFSNSIKPDDWQEFRSERDATLNSDPELASEYKAILNEMDNQQKDLEAAMIKINPKLASLVAKLEMLRKNPVKPSASSVPGKPKLGGLTQDEMSQLRAARLAAIKANPDFDIRAKQLAAKLVAFQQRLSAAMVQNDPKLATVLAKMGQAPHVAAAAAPATAAVKP